MALENAQYDAIMRHYDEIREQHRQELRERTERIYREIPRIKELADRAAELSVKAARQKIAGDVTAGDRYQKDMKDLGEERMQLLLSHGYPKDALEMQYDCPYCHDTGFVGGRHCVCFQKAATDLLYRRYSLGKVLESENFDHFSFSWYSATIMDDSTKKTELELAKAAYQAAFPFARNLGKADNNLLLYGNTGAGKTFLTHCIARDALDRGASVLYFSAGDFFDLLASSAFGRSREAHSYGRMILTCDLLIIDDLGTELTNAFTSSQLFQVLNERITRNRSTIISTNLSPNQLRDSYTERISSRIASSFKMKKLAGRDIRIRKKLKGDKV